MYYASAGVSELEIPTEKSLVIYISECQNHCVGCHTPYMHEKYGNLLKNNFNNILELYQNYITCVCFMGEGTESPSSREEFKYYCDIIHHKKFKTALYSGRDCDIEKWMEIFDYVKIGSYQQEFGPLYKKTTNQKLFKKENDQYIDITHLFWQ